jgi:hypothetical protein
MRAGVYDDDIELPTGGMREALRLRVTICHFQFCHPVSQTFGAWSEDGPTIMSLVRAVIALVVPSCGLREEDPMTTSLTSQMPRDVGTLIGNLPCL